MSDHCEECGRGPSFGERLCGWLGHLTVWRSGQRVYRWRCACRYAAYFRWGKVVR